MKFRRKNNLINIDIDPDEIFLDSQNLPNFNTQQFEGRLEKPIPKRSIFFVGIFFAVIAFIFIYKLGSLQIIHGEAYYKKSENNTLNKQPIFADRGLIYDRKDVLLAWNTWDKNDVNKFSAPLRSYINESGFGLLLGYVSGPAKDSSGNYWQDTFIGKDGVEKSYNTNLTGLNGMRITETDVSGTIQSENTVSAPKAGENIKLSKNSPKARSRTNISASSAFKPRVRYSFRSSHGSLGSVFLRFSAENSWISETMSLGKSGSGK
jgi:hypothetical protein